MEQRSVHRLGALVAIVGGLVSVWLLTVYLSNNYWVALFASLSFLLFVTISLMFYGIEKIREHSRQLSFLRDRWYELEGFLNRVVHQRDQLSLLVRLLNSFVAALKAETVAERALAELVAFLKAKEAQILLFVPDGNPIWLEWVFEEQKVRRKERSDSLIDPNNVEPLKKRSTVVQDDLVQLPIATPDRNLGMLVIRMTDPFSLRGEEMGFLQAVADQLAVALQRAFLIEMLEQMAITDPLTGIANRRYFERRLAEEVARARRYGYSLGALLLDIDSFKAINDRLGHQSGDLVLKRLAEVLRQSIRLSDFLARYGGEEFVVLTPQANAKSLIAFGERLVERVRATPITVNGGSPITLTVSIGAALFPDHAQSEFDLIRAADVALLKAKENGKNCVILFPGE
ncbi:MAG: sensor domain-containing diguanylate cyclase [Armatimonadetes bacterium]|nr:sensor domain-containing diguanylate cyclase [Armatimonadota bacterium]MDW8121500.1 sensor domain-containing diguanylate cyclase [Armatimonadota bacterium]